MSCTFTACLQISWFVPGLLDGHLVSQHIGLSLDPLMRVKNEKLTQRNYFIFIFHLIFIVFFPLPFSPLILPSSSHHHTVVLSMSSFSVLMNPSTLQSLPSTSCHLLSICESPSVLLVSSVCSLDSTYQWNHRTFVFPWLAYFTYIIFSRSTYTVEKGKFFFIFYSQVAFHCVNVP